MNILYLKTNIINKYKTGGTLASLSREYGPCPLTIRKLLVSENIPIKDGRLYQIDESFFKIIDKPEKAYFLGFLYADGYISKDGLKFELTLQEKDRHILEIFSRIALGNRSVKLKAWAKSKTLNSITGKRILYPNSGALLSIGCKPMVSDLISKGCGPNKSFTLVFPTKQQVPIDLLWHFIRGYFDGDGSIMMKKRYGQEIGSNFSIISSIKFSMGLYKFLLENGLQMGSEILYARRGFSYPMGIISTSKRSNIEYLYSKLYENCGEFFLKRKKLKFEECLSKLKDNKDNMARNISAKPFNIRLAEFIKSYPQFHSDFLELL